ncbi:MAG: 4'-phosphopantetheinyl transferase superfamily protein, partial [Sporomusaceae bacterium]|nr:4'-phosphopantetheinyl transferase superfamily protein [Sporomusaceae bacterium]
MMIIGIGIDIAEINRIAAAVKRESFVQKVFTDQEREYCQNQRRHAAASYAARFAAKEAVAK